MENTTNKNESNLENTVNEKNMVVEHTVTNKEPFEIVTLNQDGVKKGVITIAIGFVIGLLLAGLGGILFGFSIQLVGYIIAFLAFLKGIQTISSANKKVYRATCPYCKHEFGFPIKELSILCPQCHKRVIIKDNEFQIVE